VCWPPGNGFEPAIWYRVSCSAADGSGTVAQVTGPLVWSGAPTMISSVPAERSGQVDGTNR
jgi:hypothetical protein